MLRIINDFPDCLFCCLDVDIDNSPNWDESKALKAIEEKWSVIKEDEHFWCCDQCEMLLKEVENKCQDDGIKP